MASKSFFVDVDLKRNQLLKAVIENNAHGTLGSLLTVAGQFAYDSDYKQMAYYDGSDVQSLLAGSEDFASHITGENADARAASVKAIYDYYISTDSTSGATNIGIHDADGNYTSDDVEGALQEIGNELDKIGDALEVVGTITADNTSRTYPTVSDASKSGYTQISKGDAWLVTGNDIGDFSGDTSTYVQMGSNDWIGTGAMIVARVSGATDNDDDWFILDANREFSSETAAGLIAIATQSEVDDGIDDTKAVTPLKLRSFVENASGTTMYVETLDSGLTTGTVDHNLGPDVNVQVWLGGTEDITSGINLISGSGSATYNTNTNMPDTLKFVCVGKTSEYWASI